MRSPSSDRNDAAPLRALRTSITLAGIVAMSAFGAHAALSWFVAPLADHDMRTFGQHEFFARLGDAIPLLRGRMFESTAAFVVAYAGTQILATAAALALAWTLWQHRNILTADSPDRLWRWAVGFAGVSIFAVPVLVPDFWMSIAWGRMLAAGINPYYHVPAPATIGLPLDGPLMKMTYGPFWAYVSAAIMWVTRGSLLWGALLFKFVLVACWVGVLSLVRSLLRDRPIFEQALGIVMVGWLPLGVTQTVAEGHNDVAMVACVLLWLYWRREGKALPATLALTASVLFKYASAPLFLVDFLYRETGESRAPARFVSAYVARAIAAIAVIALAFAPLFRGTDFFASAGEVYRGHFFLPADAMLAIGKLSGLDLRFAAYAVEAIFPLLTLTALYRYIRFGGRLLLETATAVMLTMVMVGSGHLWPWYLLWYSALAATIPLSRTAGWAMGLTIVMPFPLLVWTVAPHAGEFAMFYLPSLVAYGLALAWFLVVAAASKVSTAPTATKIVV